MEYSRKDWWITKTATWVVALSFVVLIRVWRPEPSVRALLMVAFLAIVFPLGLRAFFYRDEIERQIRLRCWHLGCQIGAVAAGLGTVSIFMLHFPAPDAITGFILHGQLLPDGIFRAGFATGFLLLGLAQALGALAVRAYLYLPKRGQ